MAPYSVRFLLTSQEGGVGPILPRVPHGEEEPSEKWKLNKADWPSFKALCESEINETILKAKDPIDNFTTFLYGIAEKTIPKTLTKTKKKQKHCAYGVNPDQSLRPAQHDLDFHRSHTIRRHVFSLHGLLIIVKENDSIHLVLIV